jgi:aryl-alcohol dehydrogenase-like predicted oxidoreductase
VLGGDTETGTQGSSYSSCPDRIQSLRNGYRRSKTGLHETCRELGAATVAYSPLGRGFLTGQYQSVADFEERDVPVHWPRFSPENFPKNLKLVACFVEIADKEVQC